jgi:predicted Zn-dependent peptidase
MGKYFKIHNLLIISLIFIFISCKSSKYEQVNKKDSKGREYLTVIGGPIDTRLYELSNGIKVYINQNQNETKIETAIGVRVGSSNDPDGSKGALNIIRKMMFKGTTEIGTKNWNKESVLLDKISSLLELRRKENDTIARKRILNKISKLSEEASKYSIHNEYKSIISSIGGTNLSSFIDYGRTVFKCIIPSNELENWIKIERERFSNMVPREFINTVKTTENYFVSYKKNDVQQASDKLLELIWKNSNNKYYSPYGNGEFINNPSIKILKELYKKYYVANNIGICISGNVDFEKTIDLLEKYWGNYRKGDIEKHSFKKKEISKIKEKTIYGDKDELVLFGYQFDGFDSIDHRYVMMIDLLLVNWQAGLIDLNLNQQQKVQLASCSPLFFKDIGIHFFLGQPTLGQTLEDVKKKILSQIKLIKEGQFPDWLIDAIKKKIILEEQNDFATNGIVNDFISAFTMERNWINSFEYTEAIKKITKEDVVKFANKYYKDNYIVIYKRKSKSDKSIKTYYDNIKKYESSSKEHSKFYKSIQNTQVRGFKPVFLDYNKQITKSCLKEGLLFDYVKNTKNDMFQLSFISKLNKESAKYLSYAFDYLYFVGTDKYTPSGLKEEFFKNGLDIDYVYNNNSAGITVRGLNSELKNAIKLINNIVNNSQSDLIAFRKYLKMLRKTKNESLTSYEVNPFGLINYAKYGDFKKNPYGASVSEIQKYGPKRLLKMVKDLFNYEHSIYYFGGESEELVQEYINEYHNTPNKLQKVKRDTVDYNVILNENKVLYFNKDYKKANFVIFIKGAKQSIKELPYSFLFNMKYSQYVSKYDIENLSINLDKAILKGDRNYYVISGTVPYSKITSSIQALVKEIHNPIVTDKQIKSLLLNTKKQLETERITQNNIYWQYYFDKLLDVDYDSRKYLYDYVTSVKYEELRQSFIKADIDEKFVLCIVGDKKKLRSASLDKLGNVKEISAKEFLGE